MYKISRVVVIGLATMLLPLSVMACGKSADPVDVVQAQVDAYNAHDIDAFAACYAPNVTINDLNGKPTVIQGMAQLRKTYAFLAKVPKDYHVEILQRTVVGPTVVDQEKAIGLPAGKGQPLAVAVYEVRDGKILNVWFPPSR